MPFKSQAQSRYIHMEANKGEQWAKKFVADSQHGTHSVSRLPDKLATIAKKRQGRK